MKQIKFFTDQPDILVETEKALDKSGIAARHVHVFARENTQHQYDGLILESQQRQDDLRLARSIAFVVICVLLGVFSLYLQWISFLQFTFLSALLSIFPYFFSRKLSTTGVEKKVYFLIVDAEEETLERIRSAVKGLPGLLLQ